MSIPARGSPRGRPDGTRRGWRASSGSSRWPLEAKVSPVILSRRDLHTEGELLVNARADNAGVDDEAIGHVVQGQEDRVGEEELMNVSICRLGASKMVTYHLRNVHSADGTIVETVIPRVNNHCVTFCQKRLLTSAQTTASQTWR